jgi:hypothetical protein
LSPSGTALLDSEATAERLEAALASDFAFYSHNGHGLFDREGRCPYLALAGTDRLGPEAMAHWNWPNHPAVHLACCMVGGTLSRGGGRFDGHPTAALLAGAACVLASVQPLFDGYDSVFSRLIYQKVLDEESPSAFGDALLAARREMEERYPEEPLAWATTMLWGNPRARLV